jgi:hypothetical protein
VEERALALGEIAWDVLRRIVRDLLARKPGGHLIESRLDEIELTIPLALRGPAAGPAAFSERLVAAVDQILDDWVQHAAAFRPGHAYCHRCSSSTCEHSEPPSGRHVFLGYGPTGTPRWEDFAQACLDRRHPEVDRLYDDPPAFLTAVVSAGELRSDLLRAFDSGAYELLGQLVAGYFAVPVRVGEGRGICALTFQVAASHGTAGRVRYGLNILGRAPGGEDLTSLWDRQDDLPWRRAVGWAQAALATLESSPAVPAGPGRAARPRGRGVARSREDLERRIVGILAGLARRLEKDVRARGRRTGHAQARHDSGERPTRMARDDARKAQGDEILVDERNETMVVLGERGRAHFFTREGRLVSSVRYSREAIERKRKLGLWRDATAEEAESLRCSLGRDGAGAPGGAEQV